MAEKNKDAKLWTGKITAHGMDIVLDAYRTKKAAEKAESEAYARLKRAEKHTLANYKLNYEKPRKNKNWLKHSQSWLQREWNRVKVLWSER